MPGTLSSCCFSALPTQPKYLHFHKPIMGLEEALPETKWQQGWPFDVCPYFMLRSPPGEQSPSVGAERVLVWEINVLFPGRHESKRWCCLVPSTS